MTSRRIRSALQRKAVVEAIESGKPALVVAEEFRVSLSSVYNWIKAAKAAGPDALLMKEVDRRWRFGLQSADQAERFVKMLIRKLPDITPAELSSRLEDFGYTAPSRTMREVFSRLDLGTKSERRAASTPVDVFNLSDEDLEQVIDEIEAETGEYHWPSSVNLIQDYVKLPAALKHEGAVVQIVISDRYPKFGLTARAGTDKERLAAETLVAAVGFYRSVGVEVQQVTVPRGYVYDPELGSEKYSSQASALEVAVCFSKPSTPRQDPRIKAARDRLWTRWLRHRKAGFIKSSTPLAKLNDSLQTWIAEHGWPLPQR